MVNLLLFETKLSLASSCRSTWPHCNTVYCRWGRYDTTDITNINAIAAARVSQDSHTPESSWKWSFHGKSGKSRGIYQAPLGTSGLDTYFFPNLAVGQPSNNVDLSEIEICLGILIIISFWHLKKKTNLGEHMYVCFLFQDLLCLKNAVA